MQNGVVAGSDTMQFNVAQLLKEPIGATRRFELVEDLGTLDPELALRINPHPQRHLGTSQSQHCFAGHL